MTIFLKLSIVYKLSPYRQDLVLFYTVYYNIKKHCRSEVFDYDDDKNNPGNENNNDVNDREMDGRLIQCLRSKYVDTSLTFDSQCITELIDVIQTYKLNAKLY
jgi:hypothetical protein